MGGERGEGRGGGRGRGAVGVGGGWESEEVERKLCTPAVSSATEGPRGYIPRPGCIVSASSTAEPKLASRTHARVCVSELPSPSPSRTPPPCPGAAPVSLVARLGVLGWRVGDAHVRGASDAAICDATRER